MRHPARVAQAGLGGVAVPAAARNVIGVAETRERVAEAGKRHLAQASRGRPHGAEVLAVRRHVESG